MNVHIDNYLNGFNYFKKFNDNYLLNINIKLDSTNIVKIKNRGLFNYKTKNFGDLYVVVKPDKKSQLMPNILDGGEVLLSYQY